MPDAYFEEHMDHAKVIKDRYLCIHQPERIEFIYSMGCIPDDSSESDYQGDSHQVLNQFLKRLTRGY